MIRLLLLIAFSLVWTEVNQDWAGSQLMQLLPFLERRDGWGVSCSLFLVGTWLKGWSGHSPCLPLPLPYQETF